jgi:Domain of unknown function (DUF5667)
MNMEQDHPPYEQLVAYAAKELNEPDSDLVTAHTSQCAKCSAVVNRYRRVRSLLRSDYTVDPPTETIARAVAIYSQGSSVSRRGQPRIELSLFFQLGRRFAAATALATFILILVLFFGQIGTVAAATRDALPGETLYPAKIAAESLRLAVTLDPVNKAELHLAFADVRVQEMQALSKKGEGERIPATAQSYTVEVNEAEKLLASAKKDNLPVAAAGSQMEQVLNRSIAILTTLVETVPNEAKPALALAVSASENGEAEARDLQTGTNPSSKPDGQPTTTLVPGSTTTQQGSSATSTSGSDCTGSPPPSLMVSVSPNQLWPPDHKYVTVTATVTVNGKSNLHPTVTLLSIKSSEPDSGLGDGDLPNDIVIVDTLTFRLRAERSSNGRGRVYTITYTASSSCGSSQPASATVTVPHDMPLPVQQAPPGQENTPPGHQNTPPGQENTPPGHQNTPPGQENTPPGH